jgi:hypothetical protein
MRDAGEATMREQEDRIRALQNEVTLHILDRIRRDQDTGIAPSAFLAAGAGVSAALFIAAIAMVKLVG